jgi:hypothetical protein
MLVCPCRYGFGIVLLEMMTGQPAFKGMNPAMIEQVCGGSVWMHEPSHVD